MLPSHSSKINSILNMYPIPNTQYPIPNTQYPIPNTQYPISNTQYPIPNNLPLKYPPIYLPL
ncbi:hypothetical protein BGX38DRAFT_109195 [Terfezia claveryi]|nr:hypothetical protein BGX38DRAFT_109195 [Terfezia claveryi]